MDTREKIIPLEHVAAAMENGKWFVIPGLFDPLTADTAAYIAQISEREPDRRILAFVLESTSAHLDVGARAALIAALRRVDLVAMGSPASIPSEGSLSDASLRVQIISDDLADQRRSGSFVDLVLSRQKAMPG